MLDAEENQVISVFELLAEKDVLLAEQMVECEPFFRYVLHDGVARSGRADLIAGLCRDWQVFVDAGETSWPENWNGGTRCHGWSSTPTRDLIVHVLGITPFGVSINDKNPSKTR